MHLRDINPDALPWSSEAEAGVLGSLLLENGVWDQVGDMLQAKHFFSAQHATIFEAIGAMLLAGKPADVLTVYAELEKHGKAEDAGGLPYLNSLTREIIGVSNVRRYAQIVAERALLRGLVEAAGKVRDLALETTGRSVAERLDLAQAALQAVQAHGGRSMPTAISESVAPFLDRVQSRSDGTGSNGIPTGIGDLDRMLGGGFKGGKQVIIAARPSVGKSSFAQQLCLSVARGGHAAAFLSQEMSKDELVDRGAANLGRINLENIISGQLGNDEWSRLVEAVERMRDLPLFLDDQAALTLHDITAKARMLKRQHDLKVLVIDYIQLCSAGSDRDSRHHQIEALSRGLKTLAQQLDITVVTLSQLNREVEKRSNGRPQLSDLKESGAIEEDADVVMLLSRVGDQQDGFRTIHCELPKNRQGRTGALYLGFNGQHQEWTQTVAPQQDFSKPQRRQYTEDL